MVSVAYQRSAAAKRSLCLEGHPWGVSQLKGRSLLCSHATGQGELTVAHPGSHIYGIKWLTHSQIMCDGIDALITWLLSQAHMHRCLLYHSAPLWVFRDEIGTRGVHGPAVAHAFTFFRACTKLPLVWLRGRVHPSHFRHFCVCSRDWAEERGKWKKGQKAS